MASTANSNPINTNQNMNNNNSVTLMPLPLSQAIRELPRQYFKVLTRPSVKTFVEEKDKAGWGIVWVQLISLSIIDTIISTIAFRISPPDLSGFASNGLSLATLQTAYLVTLIVINLILTPISFLLAASILFGIARIFGGKGRYIQQLFTTLLFGVPLVILSYLLTLIPGTGSWLAYIPHIYSLVLIVLAMIAVHGHAEITRQRM